MPQSTLTATDEARQRRQRRAAAVVLDDDETDDSGQGDDEDMMEAVDIAGQPRSNAGTGGEGVGNAGGGGFLPEASDGGGLMPVDDPVGGATAHLGGGFLPEDNPAPALAGGGFLLPSPPADHGGFDPSTSGGSGFLPESGEPGGFFPADHVRGGFLPVPDSITAAEADEMQQDLDFASAGGFLPLPDVPAGFLPDVSAGTAAAQNGSVGSSFNPDATSPHPEPDRIALTAIPTALRSLGLHRVGLQGAELMALFEEVASDDEEAEGGKSVQRDRFREACQVLLGSDDEESAEDDGDGYRKDSAAASSSDQDLRSSGRRRLRRGSDLKPEEPTRVQPARRSTRAHPMPQNKAGDEGGIPMTTDGAAAALKALPDDFEDDEDGSSFASDSDADGEGPDGQPQTGRSGSGKPRQQKRGKRGRRTAVDLSQPLSASEIAAASDTFDLFFEESPQLPFPQKERHISLLELQRACRVLKEKMTDGDVSKCRTRMMSFFCCHSACD